MSVEKQRYQFDGRSEVMVRVTKWFQNEACLSSDARSTLAARR
jgi:hypothetical protein